MPRGKDTRNHPNRQVSRHSFGGGGYVEILRSPELQRDIDANKNAKMNHDARLSNALQNYFKIDEYTAGDVISAHKEGNEYLSDAYYGVNYPEPDNPSPADDDNIGSRIGYIPQAISQALDAHDTGKDSRGYSSPYEYPPSVRVRGDK